MKRNLSITIFIILILFVFGIPAGYATQEVMHRTYLPIVQRNYTSVPEVYNTYLPIVVKSKEGVTPTDPFIPPPGWSLIKSGKGIEVYKSGGNYVQVVMLDQGARIEFVQDQKAYDRFWVHGINWFRSSGGMCAVNGQFFKLGMNPTKLGFPLKINGEIVSAGFDTFTYRERELYLSNHGDHIEIEDFTWDDFKNKTPDEAIVGLVYTAPKRPKDYTGRTFLGELDWDKDGIHEKVLILSAKAAQTNFAHAVLKSFGADGVMMLDGGGSTQLTCGTTYISSGRLVPQGVVSFESKDIKTIKTSMGVKSQ